MRKRLTDERGFTLIEVILVSALFLVVLTATLGSAAGFGRLNRESQEVNLQVDEARRGIDRTMRQLRNLAARTDDPTILRALPSDFIFQTSDPQKTWVRNCLETTAAGHERLWSLTTPGAMTSAMTSSCPGVGWTRSDLVSDFVRNAQTELGVPLFTYGCAGGAVSGCTATAAELERIKTVRMELLLDRNPAVAPTASRLSSVVFLRNQNEPPKAIGREHPVTTRQSLLNASASTDPEGRTLRYLWFRAPAPAFGCDEQPPTGTLLGQGVTLPHTFLATEGALGTLRPIELVVCDPGGLQDRVVIQVPIP